MAYTINKCYKDLEQLLKRPLNSVDFQNAQYWFEHYPSDLIQTILIYSKSCNIFKSNYISSTLANTFKIYQILLQVRNETSSDLKVIEEKEKAKQDFYSKFDKFKL